MQKIKRKGAVVIGMSGDTVASHQKFKAKFDLNFPLLADPERKVIERYGVLKEKNMYGRKVMGIARSTFIIDEDGKIAKIFPNVKVDGHCEEVLESLR
jgi:thioredoxin-dependent peroxiredoxin